MVCIQFPRNAWIMYKSCISFQRLIACLLDKNLSTTKSKKANDNRDFFLLPIALKWFNLLKYQFDTFYLLIWHFLLFHSIKIKSQLYYWNVIIFQLIFTTLICCFFNIGSSAGRGVPIFRAIFLYLYRYSITNFKSLNSYVVNNGKLEIIHVKYS
jgi:hypothetical protein